MLKQLKKIEEDMLKEIGTLGAARASTALSKLISKGIDVQTANIKTMKVNDVPGLVGGPNVQAVGTLFEISGDLKGAMLLLSSKRTCLTINDLMQGKSPGVSKELNDEEQDTIKEMGNIIIGAYLTVLSDFSTLNMLESTPQLLINDVAKVLKEVLKEYDHEIDYVLVIETKLLIDNKKLEEDLIFILTPNQFGKLFSSIVKETKS